MIVMVNGLAVECSLVIAIYRRVPFYLESPAMILEKTSQSYWLLLKKA